MVVGKEVAVFERNDRGPGLLRIHRIRDIKHGELDPLLLSGSRIRLVADSEEAAVAPGMQVVGEARDLERTEKFRVVRIRNVHGKQGIHLPVGDEVGNISDIAGRVDLFAGRQTRESPPPLHAAVVDIKTVRARSSGLASRQDEEIFPDGPQSEFIRNISCHCGSPRGINLSILQGETGHAGGGHLRRKIGSVEVDGVIRHILPAGIVQDHAGINGLEAAFSDIVGRDHGLGKAPGGQVDGIRRKLLPVDFRPGRVLVLDPVRREDDEFPVRSDAGGVEIAVDAVDG